jgi:A1 cistron-splicing factor AAR2
MEFEHSQNQVRREKDKISNLFDVRISTGVLLLVNCPELMEFGIDNQIWKIGPKFMGIKHIPLGPHYVYFALKDENYQVRQGFFIFVEEKNRNFIRKWDKDSQSFLIFKQEEQDNFEIGINNLDFDAFLGLYPEDKIEIWKEVSFLIQKKTLEKLEPVSRKY